MEEKDTNPASTQNGAETTKPDVKEAPTVNMPKNEPIVRNQRFSNINRVEAIEGNLVIRTNQVRQVGDKQVGIRDTFIPLERAENVVAGWKNVMTALMRNGDAGWMELGEIISEYEARIKEAKEWRFKHNINPEERAL